jgi:GAF domain-containing protein
MMTAWDAPNADGPDDLCRPFLSALPISGASIAVISAAGSRSTLSSTDDVAARIDELQFELGEGPQWLAFRSGDPVLIPNTRHAGHDEWPVFGAALAQLRVRALFSIPMKMGAVTIGVASLYRDWPGTLSDDQQISALAIASAIAGAAVQRAILFSREDASPESIAAPALRREVHQATGMILVQLDTTATIAYSRLQAYAFSTGRTVQSVAHDVVTRKLTFDDQTSRDRRSVERDDDD